MEALRSEATSGRLQAYTRRLMHSSVRRAIRKWVSTTLAARVEESARNDAMRLRVRTMMHRMMRSTLWQGWAQWRRHNEASRTSDRNKSTLRRRLRGWIREWLVSKDTVLRKRLETWRAFVAERQSARVSAEWRVPRCVAAPAAAGLDVASSYSVYCTVDIDR